MQTVISPEARKKLNELHTSHSKAKARASHILAKSGRESEAFQKADKETTRLWRLMREITA